MDCRVFSPCGRYSVHFHTDGATRLQLDIRPHAVHSATLSGPASTYNCLYTATLDEKQVVELSTSAGVRKTFKSFAEMTYNALIGRATCVKFYVETVEEMKRRITTDVQARRRQQQNGAKDMESTEMMDGTAVIDLSIDEEIAQDVLAQRFFTVDYDVDFTRAVFPIPLETIRDIGAASAMPALCGADASVPGASTTSSGGSPRNPSSSQDHTILQLEKQLRTARDTIDTLRNENERLEREKDALLRLSREKMTEMQALCEDFQAHVRTASEVEKLRAKNAELRVKLMATEAALRETEKATVERERRWRSESASLGRSTSNGSPRQHSAGREASASPSVNPYLRSLSASSQQRSHRSLAPPSSSRARRTLVSPTPPQSDADRRNQQEQRQWRQGGSSKPSRFDTPPSVPLHGSSGSRPRRSHSRESVHSQHSRGVGGDSPAPRGRTGGRQTEGVQKSRGRSRGSSCEVLSQCGSIASSSRSSSASHERLYRTSTASSRHHQMKDRALYRLDSPPHRAVFR